MVMSIRIPVSSIHITHEIYTSSRTCTAVQKKSLARMPIIDHEIGPKIIFHINLALTFFDCVRWHNAAHSDATTAIRRYM